MKVKSTLFWNIAAGIRRPIQITIIGIQTPFFVIIFESNFSLGVNGFHLCSVFAIHLLKNKIITGCNIITVISDKITPFARTKPKS